MRGFHWLISLAVVQLGAVGCPAQASSTPPYVCNLARVIAPQSARGGIELRAHPSTASAKAGVLNDDTPIYICDERGKWYKIFYGGECGRGHPQGIKSDAIHSCKSGWVPRKVVEVISG